MTIFPAMTVAFAALGTWLTVRVVNRREKWAKRSLAVLAALPVLYLLSFGPACWISSRMNLREEFGLRVLPSLYQPIIAYMEPQRKFTDVANWYAQLGAAPGRSWHIRYTDFKSSKSSALEFEYTITLSGEFGWGLEENNSVSYFFETSLVNESPDVQLTPESGFESPEISQCPTGLRGPSVASTLPKLVSGSFLKRLLEITYGTSFRTESRMELLSCSACQRATGLHRR